MQISSSWSVSEFPSLREDNPTNDNKAERSRSSHEKQQLDDTRSCGDADGEAGPVGEGKGATITFLNTVRTSEVGRGWSRMVNLFVRGIAANGLCV